MSKIGRKIALVCALIILLVASAANSAVNDSRGGKNFYELTASPQLLSLGVQGYQQTEDYTCGPAAVMSLLRWYSKLAKEQMTHEYEMQLAAEMRTQSQTGTTGAAICEWLKTHGFRAVLKDGGTIAELEQQLASGVPVLIEWSDWDGHWVVLTGCYREQPGIDSPEDTLFFADPASHWYTQYNPQGISSFSTVRFEDMWYDYSERTGWKKIKGMYIIAVPVS